MVDIDSEPVAALRIYRANRGMLASELGRDAAPVLGTWTARIATPSGTRAGSSNQFLTARRALSEDQLR